jgi:hypothetical protein
MSAASAGPAAAPALPHPAPRAVPRPSARHGLLAGVGDGTHNGECSGTACPSVWLTSELKHLIIGLLLEVIKSAFGRAFCSLGLLALLAFWSERVGRWAAGEDAA